MITRCFATLYYAQHDETDSPINRFTIERRSLDVQLKKTRPVLKTISEKNYSNFIALAGAICDITALGTTSISIADAAARIFKYRMCQPFSTIGT